MEYLRHTGDTQAPDAVLGAVELKGESANVEGIGEHQKTIYVW